MSVVLPCNLYQEALFLSTDKDISYKTFKKSFKKFQDCFIKYAD